MPKGKIINIEWLIDYNRDEEEIFIQKKISWIMDEIKQAADAGADTVILIMLIDGFLILDSNIFHLQMSVINAECEKIGIKNVILLSGHGENFDNLTNKFFFMDYTLRMTYNGYKDMIDRLPSYNSDNHKFLCLGGVSTRPNRIGLIKRLYENKLLEKAEWSFFSPCTTHDEDWCRDYCKDYNDTEYKTFLDKTIRSVDTVYEDCKEYFGDYSHSENPIEWHKISEKDFMKNPGYIEPKIFEKTSFSIISEGINYWSWSTNLSFVTEKFWRTVFMRHPFILAGYTQQFKYIKYLGFKTFEQYLPEKNYALIENEEHRLDAVVRNAQWLLENQMRIKNDLEKDVEYNFNLALEYVNKQNKLFKTLQDEYGVDRSDISFYLDRSGYEHLIRNSKDAVN